MTEMRLKVVLQQIICEKWHIHPRKIAHSPESHNFNMIQTQMLDQWIDPLGKHSSSSENEADFLVLK